MLRALGWLALALLGLTLCAFASLSVGPGEFSFNEVNAWLFGDLEDSKADAILGSLRMPRILLALLVGGSLGSAGALTQGLFRNPLASPSVLGLPTGAATAVVAGFALGLDTKALWVTPALAFTGAFLMLILLFALSAGRDDPNSTARSMTRTVPLSSLLLVVLSCFSSSLEEGWRRCRTVARRQAPVSRQAVPPG